MNSGMLWAAFGLCLLVLMMTALLIRYLLKSLMKSSQGATKLLAEVQQEKRVMLNLLMSKDVQSFSILQATSNHSSMPSDEYVPQSDAAELDRLAALAGNPMTGDDDLTQDSEFLDMVGQMNGLPDLDLSNER